MLDSRNSGRQTRWYGFCSTEYVRDVRPGGLELSVFVVLQIAKNHSFCMGGFVSGGFKAVTLDKDRTFQSEKDRLESRAV